MTSHWVKTYLIFLVLFISAFNCSDVRVKKHLNLNHAKIISFQSDKGNIFDQNSIKNQNLMQKNTKDIESEGTKDRVKRHYFYAPSSSCCQSCSLQQTVKIITESCPKPPPRQPTSTTHCTFTKTIYDRKGNYLKTICDVRQFKTHDDAQRFCLSHNMDLLIVENREVKTGVMAFLNERYSWCSDVWPHGCGLWMNGRKTGSSWYAYKYYQKLDFGSAFPIQYESSHPGSCAVIKRNHGFEARNYECSKVYWFLCEYSSVVQEEITPATLPNSSLGLARVP